MQQERKVEEQYVLLRAVQVLDDIANGIFEDYRKKTGLLDITDDVFPFVVEMQDIYQKAESMLQSHIIPQMSQEDVTEEEKKVGDAVKAMAESPNLGNYLHEIIDEISKEFGVEWVKPGDIVTCDCCGKKHIVNWDGSLLDIEDISEEDIAILQSGNPVICI